MYSFHSSKSTILNSNSINSRITFELIDHPQIRKTLGLCRKFVNRQTVALELCVSLSEFLIDKVSKSQDQPYFHVCAGNRGRGKTTFALNFLRVLLENPGQYAKLANYSAFKVRSMNLFSYQKMARDLCYSFLVGKVIFLHNNSETAQEVLIWEAFSKRFTGFRPTQNGNLYSNMSSILFYHIEAVLAKTGKYCNVEGLCDDVRNMSCEEFLKLPFVIIVDEIQACEKPWVNLNKELVWNSVGIIIGTGFVADKFRDTESGTYGIYFGWDWDDVPEKLNLNLLTYLSEAAGVPRLLNYLLFSLVEDVKQLKHFNVPVLSPFPAERVDDFLNNFTSADEVLTKYDGKENDSVLRLKSPGLIMASICSLPVRLSDTFLVNNEPRSIENLENSGAVSCVPFIIPPPSASRINSNGKYLDISAELPNYYTIAYPCC
ncbi:hypothetical protein GEMRC1_005306 [Eukaryota sp. GEM-RC1]